MNQVALVWYMGFLEFWSKIAMLGLAGSLDLAIFEGRCLLRSVKFPWVHAFVSNWQPV